MLQHHDHHDWDIKGSLLGGGTFCLSQIKRAPRDPQLYWISSKNAHRRARVARQLALGNEDVPCRLKHHSCWYHHLPVHCPLLQRAHGFPKNSTLSRIQVDRSCLAFARVWWFDSVIGSLRHIPWWKLVWTLKSIIEEIRKDQGS